MKKMLALIHTLKLILTTDHLSLVPPGLSVWQLNERWTCVTEVFQVGARAAVTTCPLFFSLMTMRLKPLAMIPWQGSIFDEEEGNMMREWTRTMSRKMKRKCP